MRQFVEPTARNLLRKPMVMGVPVLNLSCLALATLGISFLAGGGRYGQLCALTVGICGYAALRLVARLAKPGWEESLLFWLEQRRSPKKTDGTCSSLESPVEVFSPDTLEVADILSRKDAVLERLTRLRKDERLTFWAKVGAGGTELQEVRSQGTFDLRLGCALPPPVEELLTGKRYVYSLYRLPVLTDPLWLFSLLRPFTHSLDVLVTFRGVDALATKRQIEVSRRASAQGEAALADIDSEVTFGDATRVLQGLSRGEEGVVEATLVIVSTQALDLDPELFCLEKDPRLTVLSVLGIRPRLHRSHFVRGVTAADLVPHVFDPREEGTAILSTLRAKPLYFSPQDSRLEALHWLVVGASGSGKSFFTGLVLSRMAEQGAPMSVLFVDHNRSFRRMVRAKGFPYFEPQALSELEPAVRALADTWDRPGTLSGIELSDLNLDDKKAAARFLLSAIELFLRSRRTLHPLYLVLDECWNFLRDEPVLVQRAFREYRKLNGAVVAITQSLQDFLGDPSGQSIFQNAPVRILLRQGEDLSRYQGILSLNSVELARASRLRQERGVFSECLIKTPFLSRIGRLYPSAEEHALLRTDNIRKELIQESRQGGSACVASA